jgi:hypothetical protein
MEEAPENGKESPHSEHANGMNVYPMQWVRPMMICCGMAVKRMGMLGRECVENEGMDCEYGDSDTDW